MAKTMTKCQEELKFLYDQEVASPGSINKNELLSKYLECTNYKTVHIIDTSEDQVKVSSQGNMFSDYETGDTHSN